MTTRGPEDPKRRRKSEWSNPSPLEIVGGLAILVLGALILLWQLGLIKIIVL